MTNPISQSAYTLKQLAEHLDYDEETIKKKLNRSPESLPPHTVIGRESKQDGKILFPVALFDQWCAETAIITESMSSELDKYPSIEQVN